MFKVVVAQTAFYLDVTQNISNMCPLALRRDRRFATVLFSLLSGIYFRDHKITPKHWIIH
jgi:hypothetical protein